MSQQVEKPLQEHKRHKQRIDWVTESTGYVTIILGYLVSIFTADDLYFANVLLFTLLHMLYVLTFWWISNRDKRYQRHWEGVVSVSILFVSNVLIGILAKYGIGFDWLLYFVTLVSLSLNLSISTTIIVSVFLFIAAAGVLVSGQNLADTTHYLIYTVAGFAFVITFNITNKLLVKERERTSVLLHELEVSNREREEANKQLRAYTEKVEELTVDRERTRMARDIHDTLGHYLTILSIQLETISKLQERDPARAAVEVAEARRVAAQSMQEVRNAVAALRPSSIATLHLPGALTQLTEDFRRSYGEMEVTLDLETQLPQLSADIQLALYRVLQEALTNIRKHTHASKVLIRLRYEAQEIELVVLDNGKEISGDLKKLPGSGFGLIGLGERVELLGGHVTYGKQLPDGFRVTVQIPIPANNVESIRELREE